MKRPSTHMGDDERAEIGRRHRTPAFGVEFEDVTGQYEGEDLDRMRLERARRFPAASIVALEKKHDALEKEVRNGFVKVADEQTKTSLAVANMAGKLEVLPELVTTVRDTANRAAEREQVTFTARVDIDKAERLDAIDAKKSKRNVWIAIATAIIGSGIVTKLLAHWGVL